METITATPDPVKPGGTLTIDLSGFADGTSVDLEIDNGDDKLVTISVAIDANGNGQATWVVPDNGCWTGVILNAGNADEVAVSVAT